VKIVLAGDWHSDVHERPMADALARLGHAVEPFGWHKYLTRAEGPAGPRGGPSLLLLKAQNKYLVGPAIRRVNRDLVALVAREQPDLLFVYRGTHVLASSLREIRGRSPRTLLVGYNNDDPFAGAQPRWPWRHFITAIPEYDRMLAYRRHNLADFTSAGARSTGLLLPWFVPAIHRPMALAPDERSRYGCDVVFVGHFENDGRLNCLEALGAAGVHVRVFGPGRGFRGNDWDAPLTRSPALRHLAPTEMVWGAEYAKALCGAKLALCFMSRRNRDSYTRRCFEIPATRTLLMSEYSEDLSAMFREGIDADYFRTPEELVRKVQGYLSDEQRRNRVAQSGFDRAFLHGHDVDTRMRTMLRDLAIEQCARQAG
jgi:spore maturation protein CgeB